MRTFRFLKQFIVLAFGITYAIFSTMAIGAVFGYAPMLLSILAGAIAIAIVNDCTKG